jgi:UDP-N-acetyl-D-glucosamine dehydrogenase
MSTEAGADQRGVVGVLGLGYAGLPLAVAMCEAGLRVVGFDIDDGVVESLRRGDGPLSVGPPEALADALRRGRLTVTGDPRRLGACSVFVVCVPTGLHRDTPEANLDAVRAAGETLGEFLDPGDLVCLESTCPVGTTDRVLAPLLARASGLTPGRDFALVCSPERIDPGNARFGVTNTPKVVGGLTGHCTEVGAAFYATFVDRVVAVTSSREAEMTKLLENAFRHVNVSLVNEISRICGGLGLDVDQVVTAAATKPFGFLSFSPGPGIGGTCVPLAAPYLALAAAEAGVDHEVVAAALAVDAAVPGVIVDRLAALFAEQDRSLSDARVVIVGVAYKANIPDARGSSARELARHLRARGATVSWYDELVDRFDLDGVELPRLTRLSDLGDVGEVGDRGDAGGCRFDAAILHTRHASLDLAALVRYAPLLVDTIGATTCRPPHVHRL